MEFCWRLRAGAKSTAWSSDSSGEIPREIDGADDGLGDAAGTDSEADWKGRRQVSDWKSGDKQQQGFGSTLGSTALVETEKSMGSGGDEPAKQKKNRDN